MKAARITSFVLFIGAGLSSARGEWQSDLETGVLYSSNFSNSDRAADIKDDWAWQSELRAGNAFQVTRDLRLNLAADLREQMWARFDAFDSVAPGGDVGLRYRFGLGRLAPWVRVEDNLSYAYMHDDDRSGRNNKFRVRGGLGLTEWLSVEAAYTFDDFEAKDEFWNLSGHSGAIGLTFDPTSSLQVVLGYSYRDGEVISYALPPRPDILRLASEAEPVNSFGSPPYTAYRLHGLTNAFSASAGYTINKYLSIQISYEFRDTLDGPLEYENHLLEAKVGFVF